MFLSWLPTPIEAGLADLSAEQVTTFVMLWCPGRGAAEAKMMVTTLRSVLRFLHVTGRMSGPLVDAVPSVPTLRVPKSTSTLVTGSVTASTQSCRLQRLYARHIGGDH